MDSKKIITILVTVVIFIALGIGGGFLYRSSNINKEIDAFENTVTDLKDLPLQYSTGSYHAAYERLLDECNLCLTNKNTGSISSLTNRINELKLNIINENKQMTDFKTQLSTFQNAISLYIITGSTKTEYNRLLSELQSAIEKNDVTSCNSLCKQLTTLLSKCKSLNEQNATSPKTDNTEKKSNTDKKSTKTAPPKVVYVVPNDSEYICPGSDSRYLDDSDLCYLSKTQLCYARNEIFARHGRIFDSPDLNTYFNSKSWYDGYIPANEFDDDSLSTIEKANVDLIKKYEARSK